MRFPKSSAPGFRLTVSLAAVVIMLGTLAACGSGSSSSGSSSGTAPAAATTSAAPATLPNANAYAKYVGSKGQANSAESPIVIGWVNNQGGPASLNFPMATAAVNAAVKMVNEQLGGIHGHPLKLVTCFVASTRQEAQQCGEKFASDKSIKEVVGGLIAVGNDGFYEGLDAQVPYVGSLGINPADYTAKNAVFLAGSNTSAFAPYATYIKQFHPTTKKVAVIYVTNPGADTTAAQTLGGYKKVGLSATLVPIDPTATDLTGPATIASSADLLIPTVTDAGSCVNLAKAFQQINLTKPVLSNPLCLALPPTAYPGGDYPHWTFGLANANLADATNPDVKLYLATSAKYGLKVSDALFAYSGIAWGQILATAKVMNAMSLSDITPANLSKAWKAFKGALPLGAPNDDCGGTLVPGQPTACANQATFATYEGKGKWKSTPQWLSPPT
jgi:branched-chain amino acid transport system substrate-binding protein